MRLVFFCFFLLFLYRPARFIPGSLLVLSDFFRFFSPFFFFNIFFPIFSHLCFFSRFCCDVASNSARGRVFVAKVIDWLVDRLVAWLIGRWLDRTVDCLVG